MKGSCTMKSVSGDIVSYLQVVDNRMTGLQDI